MKIAAIGDIHVRADAAGKFKDLFRQVSDEADVLVLAGDVTDLGTVEEAEVLAGELTACTIPVVGVVGNHDCEHDLQDEIRQVLNNDNVCFLEGEYTVIQNVGFAGVKGFGGGFGRGMLSMWGEKEIKEFVQEAVQSSLMLDKALDQLETEYQVEHKVAVMHYSPIRETVVGEPEEIFPFLGCTRFEEPINLREVEAVFHGHAHRGTLAGKTATGIPVFNVSQSVLAHQQPDKPWFVYELKAQKT